MGTSMWLWQKYEIGCWDAGNGERTLIVALHFCLLVPATRVVRTTPRGTAGAPMLIGARMVGPWQPAAALTHEPRRHPVQLCQTPTPCFSLVANSVI